MVESNKNSSIISRFVDTLIHTVNFNLKDQAEHFPKKETLSKQLHLKSQI